MPSNDSKVWNNDISMPDSSYHTMRMNMEMLNEDCHPRRRHPLYLHGGIGILMVEEEEEEEEGGIGILITAIIIMVVAEDIHSTNHRVRDGRDNHVLILHHHPPPSRIRIISNAISNDSDKNFAVPCHLPYPRRYAYQHLHYPSSNCRYYYVYANVPLSEHCVRSGNPLPTRQPIKIRTLYPSK